MLFIKYCVVCFKSFLDQRKKVISLCTEEEKKTKIKSKQINPNYVSSNLH